MESNLSSLVSYLSLIIWSNSSKCLDLIWTFVGLWCTEHCDISIDCSDCSFDPFRSLKGPLSIDAIELFCMNIIPDFFTSKFPWMSLPWLWTPFGPYASSCLSILPWTIWGWITLWDPMLLLAGMCPFLLRSLSYSILKLQLFSSS